MLLPFDLLLTCHSVHLVKDVNTVQWTGLCVAAATILQSVTYIYMYMCVCVCVSHMCSGCVMQCGMLLVATALYLQNKPLLC